MNSTVTGIAAAIVIGFFVYSNYGLRNQVRELEVQVADAQGVVSAKNQELQKAQKERDQDVRRLEEQIKLKEKQGITQAALDAKQSEIDELVKKVTRATELLKQQKDSINKYKAQLRQAQAMIKQGSR